MKNKEPLTWACECGQMNLLTDRTCRMCGGSRQEYWAAEDRERAVIEVDLRNPEGRERIVGFDVERRARRR